jgi:urease accessory protein
LDDAKIQQLYFVVMPRRGGSNLNKALAVLIAALTLLGPSAAWARTGIGGATSFAHGFLHPVTGADHVLAMVKVGLLAWRLRGRALWLVPATFVLVMAAGGALGIAGVGVPLVEAGIALSVVVLRAMVAFGVKPPLPAVTGSVALFAICHGHAHGSEMPEAAAGVAYGFGFMLATANLHVAGIGLGFAIGRIGASRGPATVRASGALAAVAGVTILVGLI